jgi:alkaline phosphatase
MPLYSLLGNHDVGSLGFREAASLLGADRTFFSFDIDGAHFVALGFEQPYSDADPADVRAVVPAEQLDWLAEDLALASTSVVVFSHYGLADDDMQGNFWFESEPQAAVIENRAEVRSLLERSGRVRAVISAHQHWNRLLVQNGIPYVTVTSLVENTRNDGVPAAARTLVTLREDRLVVEVRGNDPARFSLPT